MKLTCALLILALSSCGPIPPVPFPIPTPFPTPVPTPTPGPTPTPLPTPEPTPSPTPEPSPSPSPSPLPTPTPVPSSWKETGDDDSCRRVGEDGVHRKEVEEVLDSLGIQWPTGFTEKFLYSMMQEGLRKKGLFSSLYGEELAVTGDFARSENYDLLLSNGFRRSGPSAYRSTCTPATRSEGLSSMTYPQPVIEVRIKTHGPKFVDGVALSGGDNPDFPGRPKWPACGPEDVERREKCDKALDPKWEGGGKAHPTNPWLWQHEGHKIRVCAKGVCSPWLQP